MYKQNFSERSIKKRIFIIALLVFLCFLANGSADVVILKSGQKIEGTVVEQKQKYIIVDLEGIEVTYYWSDIKSIEEDELAWDICSSISEIELVGSTKYKQQVLKALKLLCRKSYEAYQIVEGYVGKIEEAQRSGMDASANPPTFFMSEEVAFSSLTGCAGAIVHDSYHSKLYHDYIREYGKPVPYEIWGGFEAERKCIIHEIKVLKKIGAPKHEIDYCLSLDGTHADVNKDGKLDDKDYELRDW